MRKRTWDVDLRQISDGFTGRRFGIISSFGGIAAEFVKDDALQTPTASQLLRTASRQSTT